MILDEDVDTAEIVTFEEVTVMRRDRTTATRKVTVPLFQTQPGQTAPAAADNPLDGMANDIDMIDTPPEAEPVVVPVVVLQSSKVSLPTFDWNQC